MIIALLETWDAPSVVLVITAFGTMLVTVISAIAAAMAANRTARTVGEVKTAQASNLHTTTTAIGEVAAKAEVISGHVNSAATASVVKIESLESKVALLLEVIAGKDKAAALLAQAEASRTQIVASKT